VITRLAERHEKTPAQVVLRWHLDLGNVVIPKSVTPGRIRENCSVFDFALTPEDARQIAGLESGHRIGPDPDVVGVKPSGFSSKIDTSIA
jgi:2,5-diketo-D-gluconate reductase A